MIALFPRFQKAVILSLFLLLFSGCGLFSTRDPEEPSGGQSGGDIALSPDEVFLNLSRAVSLRDPDLYLRMIDDSFYYAADAYAYPENPLFFETWSYPEEDRFIRKLLDLGRLPTDSTATLDFERQEELSWVDSSYYRETYLLEVRTTDEALSRYYSGTVELTLVRNDDGGWRVLRWIDETNGDEYPTLSRLRATL